ncbi:hypothetical protein [Roseovarius sp. MMSF_3281]|uniref:hypothetical protein n=1 Tax=Roseovarius sp. MMSF_3281 TaxID=3046694 RepID=UPI00273F4F70|nr:hypothetical protein [Roseovarius sp. MMSF_3281]
MTEIGGGVLALGFAVAAMFLMLWLYILLPAEMAERRSRSAVIWVLIAFVASPFLAILLLLALGDADD